MENNNIPEQEVLDSPAADEVEVTSEIETDMFSDVSESENLSETLPHDTLEQPEHGDEITADEHAMDWHGMTDPTESESSFDMDVLDDPELDVV